MSNYKSDYRRADRVSVENIEAVNGDDEIYFIEINVYDNDTENFQPLNLEIISNIWIVIKKLDGETVFEADMDTDEDIKIKRLEDSKIELWLKSSATSILNDELYNYTMYIVTLEDLKHTILKGTISIV